ncbi:MAG: Helix-hairpin-helix motif [Solirubrobacterales bacterium]|jgi:hypothetical protein|nr:Helix-hairpin-helix motif [Solirubrobacterales bacterium]
MDSSRTHADDWLVGPGGPERKEKPAKEPSPPARPSAEKATATEALAKRLDEDERTIADLRVRLDALESGRTVRKLTDELRLEIREWLTEELNRIAARIESGTPAAAPLPARERAVLEESDFLPYAERVEEQLREVEQRVERAGRVVRDISAGQTPARSTPREPTPDEPGREAEESSVDVEESSGDVIGRALDALNRISFEQLRDLGLSVTQSARLLARRDARGSLASFDDLSDLAGFSREVLDQLRKRLSPG